MKMNKNGQATMAGESKKWWPTSPSKEKGQGRASSGFYNFFPKHQLNVLVQPRKKKYSSLERNILAKSKPNLKKYKRFGIEIKFPVIWEVARLSSSFR